MTTKARVGRPSCGAEREVRTWVRASTWRKLKIEAAKRGVTVTRLVADALVEKVGK